MYAVECSTHRELRELRPAKCSTHRELRELSPAKASASTRIIWLLLRSLQENMDTTLVYLQTLQ